MKIYLFISFLFFCNSQSKGQSLLTKDSITLMQQMDISNMEEHFYKKFSMNGGDYTCSIYNYFHNEFPKFLIIPDHSELVYFENYRDKNFKTILCSGYLKLVIDSNLNYCWVKNLVWTHFNMNGEIEKKEFYNNGKLIPQFF